MWLIIHPGLLTERVVPVPEGITTLGRTEENSVCVIHASMSRRHARLEREGERVVLVDLQSRNGTFVNESEARVERSELRSGSHFRCGEVSFKLMPQPSFSPSFADTEVLPVSLIGHSVLSSAFLRHFPTSVSRKLHSTQGAALERREAEVTVLFCSASGFHGLGASGGPLQVLGQLEEHLSEMEKIVFRHEGTLLQNVGHEVMAVWGAPFSEPDDADRALRAAVEMQHAVDSLNARWEDKPGPPRFRLHTGLHTGQSAVGIVGSKYSRLYTCVGEASYIARAVCGPEAPGELCITEAALRRCLERPWPLKQLQPLSIQGSSKPVTLYQIDWRATPYAPLPPTATKQHP